MAGESGLSRTTILRIRNAFGPQPQCSRTFRLSGDPAFADNIRDIVDLHLSPPDTGARPHAARAAAVGA